MRFKKGILITILLLIIFTIGSVSAIEDTDFDDALSDGISDEASLDASFDEEISEGSDEVIASSEDQVLAIDDEVSEGSDEVIASSEDQVLAIDDEVSEGSDEVIASLENEKLNDGEISEDNFGIGYIASFVHEDNLDGYLCDVWIHDVDEGSLILTIENSDGYMDQYERSVEGTNHVQWDYHDLYIIDGLGKYTVNLTYTGNGKNIILKENHIFALTYYNYEICEGDIYADYPFIVIRFEGDYDEEEDTSTYIEVYLDDGDEAIDPSGENPYKWTLEDLGITEAGKYTITIKTFNGDEFIEDLSYELNVFTEFDNLVFYSNQLGVESGELDNPVLYLLCHENFVGEQLTLRIRRGDAEEFDTVEEFDAVASKSWTLDDLGIEHNAGYDIKLYNEFDEEIASTWLNVNGIISEDSFNCYVSSHESRDNEGSNICEVWFDENAIQDGTLTLTFENPNGEVHSDDKDIEGPDSIRWELGELLDSGLIDDYGEYKVNVSYSNGDKEFLIVEDAVFVLTQLNYNICQGEIYIAYPFDVIRFYSEYDEEEDVSTYINIYIDDNDEPIESGSDGRFTATLDELGIREAGDHNIRIEGFRGDEKVDDFTYSINVVEEFDGIRLVLNELGVENWCLDGPVLYIISPDDMIGTPILMQINDEDFDEFDILSTSMNWTLEDLRIDHNEGYNIKLFNQFDDLLDEKWLNVNGIISEDSFNYYISSHDTKDNDESIICEVWLDENAVQDGTLTLSIEKDGAISTYVESINGKNNIRWELGDLDIIEGYGDYHINLTYSNNDDVIILAEDNVFTLTKLNYNICEGVYIAYPFDVIRFYADDDEESSTYIKVYLDDSEEPIKFGERDPFRWTLDDLGITDSGEHIIKIEGYRDDKLIETFQYTLYVDDDSSYFRAISNQFGVSSWEIDDPALYLISPENNIGNIIRFQINDEDEYYNEVEFEITSSLMSWTLEDLGIDHDNNYEIRFIYEDDEVAYANIDVRCIDSNKLDAWIWDEDEDGVLYLDCESAVIRIFVPEGYSGKLSISVDGVVLYTPKIYPNEYIWDLETLNISAVGEYDIFVKLINDDETEEILIDGTLNVIEFNNDTVRLKKIRNYDDDGEFYKLYCPENAELTFIVNIYEQHWNPEEGDYDNVFVETIEIPVNSSFYNKWTDLSDAESNFDLDSNHFAEIVCVKQNGEEIVPEESKMKDNGVGFGIDEGRYYDGGIFGAVSFPFNREFGDANITISSGDFIFSKKISEMEYNWENGQYIFYIDMDDMDSFDSLSDKDVITSVFTHDNGKMTRWHCIEKNDEYIRLYDLSSHKGPLGTICAYGLEIIMEIATPSEDEDEEEEEGDGEDTDNYFAVITIPDSFNVTEGEISVISGDKIIFSKKLSGLERLYQYWIAGYEYFIYMDELDLDNLNDKDVVNVTLSSNGKILEHDTFVYRCGDEGYSFNHYSDRVEFSVHYGELSDPDYDWGIRDGTFIDIDIPDMANISDGTILITLDDGTVLFNKSLSSFKDSGYPYVAEYDDEYLKWDYTIMANETVYENFPENQNLTFTLYYGNNTITHKGIREGSSLKKIVSPDDILINLFDIVISDDVLVNGSDFAVTIDNIDANRQSIYYDVGGGYFSVYVNGVKVENLGRINQYDGETELELTHLCSNTDGVNHLEIYLADLGITENGVYDIKVTHNTEDDYNKIATESEILNQKVTLTSNVKANYTNESIEWFTGYGIDPVLMYLDTYYGDISDTTGTITVYNSENNPILTKDIKDLAYEDGRYSLRYSDFTDKNFGDKVTVKYSDGNERNGETELDVKWRDIDPTDFSPVVNDDVDDYYGNFVSLNIPELVDAGQIVVTIKFKNNRPHNISDMDVSTDFDSQAVYTFNIADIKNHYENGNFALAMSDLGFYEIDGDYEVDVKFTGDGSSFLNVTEKAFDVALLHEIVININESSRYGVELPFASVQIFEPMNAYAELYVDGIVYGHKTFEKGLSTLISSGLWAPGTHTAEVKVFDAEFGSLLTSSSKEFEVLTQSEGVEAIIGEVLDDKAPIIISFNAPKEGTVFTRTEKGVEKTFEVNAGENSLNLGALGQGNHTIWVLYNETLDDGSISFYNNYLNVSVGGWMILPDPLVLDDEDTIRFNFGEGAEGSVTVNIDNGRIQKEIPVVNGSAEFKLDESLFDEDPEHKYGKHSYEIIYSGDESHDSLSKSGEFTVAYLLKDNLLAEGFPYREYYIIIIRVPGDAKGDVTIVVNGTTYTAPAQNGQAEFKVPGFEIGQYPVNISYGGDERYPASSYENTLYVSHYGVVCDMVDGKRIVSLRLPANANGNLTVYNDNRGSKLYTKALENGYAEIDLSDLTVGIYELRAVYEGEDYDVRSYSDVFKVMPYVYIEQNKTIGEDIEIFVDLNDSTGYMLIVMDGLSPVLTKIKDGKVNYTLKSEDYSFGNHTVYFEYFGESFDKNVFKEYDESTGKYGNPIDYGLEIQGKRPEMTMYIDDDGNIIMDMPSDVNGMVAVDINGKHLFDFDVTEMGTVNIDGSIIIKEYKNGKKHIIIKLSEKLKKQLESEGYMDVVARLHNSRNYLATSKKSRKNFYKPKIVAKAFNVVYTASKKYSVTVYGRNGKVASGVQVKFLINNKAYKTVKTNNKGVASVVITKKPGTYKITSKASGVSVTNKLKVKHVLTLKKVKVKRSAKKLVLKATLKKVNGKYLKNKKVTIKFNGKKYKVKTNKKGVAKLTIKQNVLKSLKVGKKVKYQATYKKDTVKKSVKVKK